VVIIPSNLKLFLCGSVACAYLASPALAQTDAANEAEYRLLLEAIDNKKVNIAHQQAVIGHQNQKIAHLNAELVAVEETKVSVEPMIDKMASNIEREIKADYPFEYDARMFRLNSLKETMDNPAATVGDKYRKVLGIYETEVNYGQSIVAADGDHPVTPTTREGDDRYQKEEDGSIMISKKTLQPVPIYDGTYLRYGRLSYVYINSDGSSPLRYDLKTRKWVPLKGRSVDIRMAMRMAKGEVAPSVVMAPIMPMN